MSYSANSEASMKKLLIIIFCAGSLTVMAPTYAQESPIVVENSDSQNVLTGFFKSVWLRLRSINPQVEISTTTTDQVYTAGIRGADTSNNLMQPYWKGDLTQNENFIGELQTFNRAQAKMNAGDLEMAVQSFDSFLNDYGQSILRPNALLGKGISLAGLGEKKQSIAVMQQFVRENSKHPLVSDARQVVEELHNNLVVAEAIDTSADY